MSLAKLSKLMESRDNIQKFIIQEKEKLAGLEQLRKLEEANVMNTVKTLEKMIAYETMGRDVCVCVQNARKRSVIFAQKCKENLKPAMIMMIVEAAVNYFVDGSGEVQMQLFKELETQLAKNEVNVNAGCLMDTSVVLDYSDEDDCDPTIVI